MRGDESDMISPRSDCITMCDEYCLQVSLHETRAHQPHVLQCKA